jgi:hypothetical protein
VRATGRPIEIRRQNKPFWGKSAAGQITNGARQVLAQHKISLDEFVKVVLSAFLMDSK